jgi:ferredoxin-thioredoxin reductase catalytic subunit
LQPLFIAILIFKCLRAEWNFCPCDKKFKWILDPYACYCALVLSAWNKSLEY